MSRAIVIRLSVAALLAALLLTASFAQSQETQSVAEAARRAKEKKKAPAKPAKVITDETLDVRKGDVQSAAAEVPRVSGSSDAKDQTGTAAAVASAPSAAGSAAKGSSDEKLKKDLEDLKRQVKEAEGDLDLLQRKYRLDNEAFYSRTDYGGDAAGKQKLDDEKRQIADKKQEVERLKAKLADLQQAFGNAAPPQP